MASTLRRLVFLAFCLITAQALFATPYLSGELLLGEHAIPVLIVLSSATLVVLVFLLWRFGDHAHSILQRLASSLARVPTARWLLAMVAFGVALRVAWVVLYPAPLESDSQVYFELARNLHSGGEYVDPRGEYAHWPPGLPFILYASMLVVGNHPWVPTVLNTALFAASVPLAHRLGVLVGGIPAARLATLLLTVWPNHVFATGTGGKELPMAVLLMLATVTFVFSTGTQRPIAQGLLVILSGAALALASLTQPAALLLGAVFPLYDVLRRAGWRATFVRSLVLLAAMAAAIGPWTARNARVLGEPVLIATNGGSVFYRANNPLATGGYTESGARSLAGYPELERNRTGFRWGIEWIRENPAAFLRLAVRKQILFLGDDGVGAYETLKRGLGIEGTSYLAFKALSNTFWMLLWILASVGLLRCRRASVANPAFVSFLMLIVCYFYAVDSVFESGSRHHLPLVGIFAALAALPLGLRPSNPAAG